MGYVSRCYIGIAMRNRISAVILCLLSTLAVPCHGKDSAPTINDLIIWEIQSWKPGGGHQRLTLWQDGYSEIEIVPQEASSTAPRKPKSGWEMIRDNDGIRYVHRNAYTPNMTRKLFRKALHAGIRRLKSFRPAKKDDGGTRVVVSLDGKRMELLIPYFTGRHIGTTNHRRFQAVSAVLGNFDKDPFTLPKPKPKPKPAKAEAKSEPVTPAAKEKPVNSEAPAEPAKTEAQAEPAKPDAPTEAATD